jgi:hypothetical protein
MLTLEAIAVLGLVYIFFMYATLRATRVEEKERKSEGWRRILLDDQAHRIMVQLDRPVLVVRQEEAER